MFRSRCHSRFFDLSEICVPIAIALISASTRECEFRYFLLRNPFGFAYPHWLSRTTPCVPLSSAICLPWTTQIDCLVRFGAESNRLAVLVAVSNAVRRLLAPVTLANSTCCALFIVKVRVLLMAYNCAAMSAFLSPHRYPEQPGPF